MFTGIIAAVGKVVKYERSKLWVRAPFRRVSLGESISVEGVCLTVAGRRGDLLSFDVGPETARITTLGQLKAPARVNLERALRVGDRLGGHWVTGHVEETGTITQIERAGTNRWFYLRIPKSFLPLVIAKGSLAVDGISLTVVSRKARVVKLMLIPHTLAHTTLGSKKVGDVVNLEADLLAKYARARNT